MASRPRTHSTSMTVQRLHPPIPAVGLRPHHRRQWRNSSSNQRVLAGYGPIERRHRHGDWKSGSNHFTALCSSFSACALTRGTCCAQPGPKPVSVRKPIRTDGRAVARSNRTKHSSSPTGQGTRLRHNRQLPASSVVPDNGANCKASFHTADFRSRRVRPRTQFQNNTSLALFDSTANISCNPTHAPHHGRDQLGATATEPDNHDQFDTRSIVLWRKASRLRTIHLFADDEPP